MNDDYLKDVREQYESYPYPMRNPDDEKVRLLATSDSILDHVNHNCFQGKQSFEDFRVLVAGGGTGTAAIFLAEQLRDRNAEIVYLDLSSKSMEICQRRAELRGLNNIEWINGSILSLPDMTLEKFDFINCCGVLHHLEDPKAGLMALKSVLKDGGAMGIMLYAKYGREGVYQMQELMRLINADEPNLQVKVDTTKEVLSIIPNSNCFKKYEYLFVDHVKHGDIGVYDLFLHSQDRAYTISEVHELVEGCDLRFISHGPWESQRYKPDSCLRVSPLLTKIKKLSVKEQSAIVEIIRGDIIKHTVYITSSKSGTVASAEDLNNVPFFSFFELDNLYDLIKDKVGQTITITRQDGVKVVFTPNSKMLEIIKYIDGNNSLADIFEEVIASDNSLTQAILLEEFCILYEQFSKSDWMLFRDKSLVKIKSVSELQLPITERYS